jgi:hypothetical protein
LSVMREVSSTLDSAEAFSMVLTPVFRPTVSVRFPPCNADRMVSTYAIAELAVKLLRWAL